MGRLPECRSQAAALFLQKQQKLMALRAGALRRAGRPPEEYASLEAAAAELANALHDREPKEGTT